MEVRWKPPSWSDLVGLWRDEIKHAQTTTCKASGKASVCYVSASISASGNKKGPIHILLHTIYIPLLKGKVGLCFIIS